MSQTPEFRKVGLGVVPSPSPFLTPRPERRRLDTRSVDWNVNRQDKDREVNVQVLLRCRPLGEEEQRLNVPSVISCNENKREVTILQNIATKQVDRVFTFDKVFGPKSQQRSIYDQAISPIVNEVLDGYNCTVFAYGQTGTGKTYTMEGGMRKKGGDLPAEAGVIPRAVRQIFDTLEAQKADYSMKVTFLELYNEEITDLLAPEEYSRCIEERQRKPISLMEDGKGCVLVRGLEEEAVYSANEIYSLLERGSSKRRTADTLLNKHSSRSHSIFSITIHIKETAIGDEDVIKCGKLNLVDLAGSENISRSGSREGRAREAGEINKSLLTLGRVINALVEHSVHIPYRDSKLTRLLRDSLGGKTKTCIIATVSPSGYCLEETLSTLDYAHRAKNIKNKPEANQKISKTVLLKDLYLEIEKMKEDVRAAREKNGVYIPHERHAQDEVEKKVETHQNIAMATFLARNEKIEQLEVELEQSKKECDRFRELYLMEQEEKLDVENELKNCKINLANSNKALCDLLENYNKVTLTVKEKESIITKLLVSENTLIEQAKKLRTDLQNASEDITSLFGKIELKNKIEATNQGLVSTFGSELDHSLKGLQTIILGSISEQEQQMTILEKHMCSSLASKCEATHDLQLKINKMSEIYTSGAAAINNLAHTLQKKATSDQEQLQSTIMSQSITVENFLVNAVLEANHIANDIQNSLNEQKQLFYLSSQQQQENTKKSLVSAQAISKATCNVFSELHNSASNVMNMLKESHIAKSQQLATFEDMFKEEAVKEEKQAMEKIATILQDLTLKKTAMVTEASSTIQQSNTEENKKLQREMSTMQQASVNARTDIGDYMEKAESNFFEQSFLQAESMTLMGSCLAECSKEVDSSREQWANAQMCINDISDKSIAEIETNAKENVCANQSSLEEFISISTSLRFELDSRACDMLTSVNDSLTMDKATKAEVDDMSNLCLGQLKLIKEKHGENVANIQHQTEQRLKNDYLVDHSAAVEKRVIDVPSLSSIDDMKARGFENQSKHSIPASKSKFGYADSKNQQQHLSAAITSPGRAPFADVN